MSDVFSGSKLKGRKYFPLVGEQKQLLSIFGASGGDKSYPQVDAEVDVYVWLFKCLLIDFTAA